MLPFEETNLVTVILSWLNLELGIDTCYFPGMDTYIKTWLQLVFPTYIIFLVVLVIIISSHSSRFSNLIGKKDPVATLATLILLSYAKLLEVCFKSLSVGILQYPDSSTEMVWLPDATVKYLSGKHVPLFFTSSFILLVGFVYTALLFSWQWFVRLSQWRVFSWSRYQKLQVFVQTYHTPYTPKCRYWTGLLLLARAILYLVAAVNVSNDPQVALSAVSFTVCCIVLLKGFIESRVYRKRSIQSLETFFYLNILFFAIFTSYFLGKTEIKYREATAYTSVTTSFFALLLIILYHVYTHTRVFSKLKKAKLGRTLDRLIPTETDPNPESPPPDNDTHRFAELLDIIDHPASSNDYELALKRKPPEPTRSVVVVERFCSASPNPEEVNTPEIPLPGEPDTVANHELTVSWA